MTSRSLLRWLNRRVAAGRREYADIMRTLIVNSDSAIAERLPFDCDEVFLEPGLFTYFSFATARRPTLSQLLSAALAGQAGVPVPVRSDCDGRISLPGLAQLQTRCPNSDFLLTNDGNDWQLHRGGGQQPFSLDHIPSMAGAEIYASIPLHFRPLIDIEQNEVGFVDPVAFATTVSRAMDAMEAAWPALALLLRTHVRAIVALPWPRMNSFATASAHGAIFLSVAEALTVPQLVEELAHQGGHVIFNAATIDPSALFAVDPAASMSSCGGAPEDGRSAYEALHGLITEALMVTSLDQCLSLHRWSEREQFELRGRLAYIGVRGHGDLAAFDVDGLLSKQGSALRDLAAQCIYPPLYRRRHELEAVDLSGQPYSFSEAICRKANGFRRS